MQSMQHSTDWGTPVVFKSVYTHTFEIIRYGDVSQKMAGGFKDINEVGKWVREQGGSMGARGHNYFIGEYREITLP